jgi:uncharacterized protein (DUF2384 family)
MSKSSSGSKRSVSQSPSERTGNTIGWAFSSIGNELAIDLQALSGAEARFEEAVAAMAAAHTEIRALISRQAVPRQKVSRVARPALVDAKIKLLSDAKVLLGDLDLAATWLREPIPSLNSLTPFELIETPEGKAALENYMNQIRYGVYI